MYNEEIRAIVDSFIDVTKSPNAIAQLLILEFRSFEERKLLAYNTLTAAAKSLTGQEDILGYIQKFAIDLHGKHFKKDEPDATPKRIEDLLLLNPLFEEDWWRVFCNSDEGTPLISEYRLYAETHGDVCYFLNYLKPSTRKALDRIILNKSDIIIPGQINEAIKHGYLIQDKTSNYYIPILSSGISGILRFWNECGFVYDSTLIDTYIRKPDGSMYSATKRTVQNVRPPKTKHKRS